MLNRLTHLAVACAALSATGCYSMNHTQSGALVGTGLGALTGAMVGGDSGHAGGGALIGAAVGALAGGAVGHSEDHREAAFVQAAWEQQSRNALTNFDLVRMAQSGMGDDVMISSIQIRGGRFDLGTEALINLKANGVSDRVIVAMQQSTQGVPGQPAFVGPAPVIVQPAPVFVAPPPFYGPPPPPPGLYFEFGGGRRHHHHHH